MTIKTITKTYEDLLKAPIEEIEQIRRQPNIYSRTQLTIEELEELRKYLDSIYSNTVQTNFAYNIYMRAG
ncbi:UNVERIFIED_CONTAM: hypothetical protein Cloal_4157 [Acetivibrio alkalicellulosi]